MEANTYDDNHLDSNVLLPPRKRLLACMKKQNADGNGILYPPSKFSHTNDFDTRLNNLLSAHLRVDNPSQEEIVEASRSAAEAAVKIAVAARAAAEEKAVIATMAMAAAKKALELVATVDEQETSSSTENQQSMKNKTKKHVQVQLLYDNKKPRVENGKASDEELARQLHQAINSSPRVSNYSSPSDLKCRNNNGSVVGDENSLSASNRYKLRCDRVASIVNVDDNVTKVNKVDISIIENVDVCIRIQSKDKFGEEDTSKLGRKRGRMKQKKLPLSICHDRDQLNPKEDDSLRSSELVDENSVIPIERSSLWKCQSFKAAARLKRNKAMQS